MKCKAQHTSNLNSNGVDLTSGYQQSVSFEILKSYNRSLLHVKSIILQKQIMTIGWEI